jgi:hypothetical protein
MNIRGIYTVIVLAFAVSSISMTLSKARIFKPIRRWINARNKWLGELVDCPYCTIHWVAFAAIAIYRPVVVVSGLRILDLFVSAFVVIAVASVVSGWIFQAFAGTASAADPEQEQNLQPFHQGSRPRGLLSSWCSSRDSCI